MRISDFLSELKKRDSRLFNTGVLMLVLTGVMIIPLVLDSREILGINPWIKPIKFSLSISIYVFTFGWFLHYIRSHTKTVKLISVTTSILMVLEICILIIQSARGETSHFNFTTTFNSRMFAALGIFIGISALMIIIYLLTLLFRKAEIQGHYKWSIIFALILFLVSNWVGGEMIKNGAHTIGASDGGEGILFFNWSVKNGDLRIAHFLGIHSIQIIPFLTYRFTKRIIKPSFAYGVLAIIVSVFLLVFYSLYSQAIAGNPLFSY